MIKVQHHGKKHETTTALSYLGRQKGQGIHNGNVRGENNDNVRWEPLWLTESLIWNAKGDTR